MTVQDFLKSQRHDVTGPLRGAAALTFVNAVLMILQAALLAGVVKALVFDEAALSAQADSLMALIGVVVLRTVLTAVLERVTFEAAARVKEAVRHRLTRQISDIGPVHIAGEGVGGLVATHTHGVEALEGYFNGYLPALATMVIVPLAVLVVVLPFDWISALVMAVTAPLIPVFMILIGKGAEHLNQRQWRKLARMSSHFLDMVQGLPTLKMFNASRREADAIAAMSDGYRQSTMKVLRVAFLSSLTLEFFATVSVAVVAVLIGFRLLAGDMEFYHGFLILLLAPEFYLPLRQMGTHYHARMDAIGAAERMLAFFDIPTASTGSNTNVKTDTPPTYEIRFQDVHFTFDTGCAALNGIDFTINSHQRVALTGPSGAGKSTLINLVLGFIEPQRGSITVGGVPLRDMDIEAWRSCLAYIPQTPAVFYGTVLDNIRLAQPNASRADVIEAARKAHADTFIRELPQGYDTHLSERGLNLSGGQRQRIALARAFLRDAPVLILDEPTANLDLASERLIEKSLAELVHGRTVLTIAHRLSTMRNADRVVKMSAGRIVEDTCHV